MQEVQYHVRGQSWPGVICAPCALLRFHFLMPLAPPTERKDMTVVAIPLAPAGAFRSIGNVTSHASSSMDQCLRPLHDAQVLARAVALLVIVIHGALFDLILVAAVFPGDLMDSAETRREGSGEGVTDCSRAVVPRCNLVA